jgi:phosphate transport system substrate-binding protein
LPIAHRSGEAPILPSQSSLADGSYPLRRTVNMVLTEGKSGLGTGFVSFVANHKGQRIILKLGVAPITVPPRNVEIVHP